MMLLGVQSTAAFGAVFANSGPKYKWKKYRVSACLPKPLTGYRAYRMRSDLRKGGKIPAHRVAEGAR